MTPPAFRPAVRLPDGGRVAVFRALPGLGDALCAVPALRSIRRARPDLEVTLIGLPSSAGLAARFGEYVDRFTPFPGFPGLPEQQPDVRALSAFLADAQRRRYDLAIQLHGSGELTNAVVELLGAAETAGYAREGRAPAGSGLWLPWRDDVPEIRRWLGLMAHLGSAGDDATLEFPVDPAGEDELERLAGERGDLADAICRPFVCLHPGASVPERRWPATRFAEVGDALAAQGYAIVVTGSGVETDVAATVVASMQSPAVSVAGLTSLDALAVLLGRSALLVSNDTGIAHLADALRVRSVVVFRDSSIRRWGPLDRTIHRVTRGPTARVVEAAFGLLDEGRTHAA
jgi:ADP-heptose:LPS heptosyltransferase